MSSGIRIPDGRESSIPRKSSIPGKSAIPTENPKTEKSASSVSSRRRVESRHPDKHISGEKVRPESSQNRTQAAKTPAPAFPQKAAFDSKANNPSPSNLSLSNSSLQESLLEKFAESSGKSAVSARELFRQTAATLGLPVDTLSVTLLAFARVFSLSISQTLIAALRREVLASVKTSSPRTAKEKAALEAKALGAAAALDKGVILSPEALERYARLIGFPDTSGGGKENSPDQESPLADRDEVPDEQELRAIAEKETKEDGLLDYLNALPGKNGKHWMVFPFKIKVKGTELKVFIRLLKEESFSLQENSLRGNEHLIVDITGPKRQYRCFLGKIAGKLRADIRVYPELKPKALKLLAKEAERFLGEGAALAGNFKGFEEILVRNGEEVPSWVEDLYAQSLFSVNKEV